MNPAELKAALEAIIYVADEPATVEQLATAVGAEKAEVRAALDELVAGYATEDRGIEIRKVAGGYKFYTKPQHHEVVRRFVKSLQPPLRLTMPALETLAVIAYKQPVTLPEINEIRGVNCAGVIQTLLEKRLITTAGRKQVVGPRRLVGAYHRLEALCPGGRSLVEKLSGDSGACLCRSRGASIS